MTEKQKSSDVDPRKLEDADADRKTKPEYSSSMKDKIDERAKSRRSKK